MNNPSHKAPEGLSAWFRSRANGVWLGFLAIVRFIFKHWIHLLSPYVPLRVSRSLRVVKIIRPFGGGLWV